jgi:hypothetical protein
MSLVFPLQPSRPRKAPNSPDELLLKTTSKRFTVGSTLIFIFLILLSMFLAAGPLFKTMLEQGTWFDYLLAGFFYSMLYVFPLIALLCWFYQESLFIKKSGRGFELHYSKSFGPIHFSKKDLMIASFDELKIQNWIGSRNMASIQPDPSAPEQLRYATRGHWMLQVEQDGRRVVLERRAKKDEIEWLKAIIVHHFQ